MSGFIALHREAFEHPLLQDPERFRAWFWMVSHARWESDCVTLSFTWSGFAAHMGWNKLSAKRFIARFERRGMISVERWGKRLDVTILDRSTFAILDNGIPNVPLPAITWARPRPVFGAERGTIPSRLREAVILRDGAKCAYCNNQVGPFEIDHVLSVANGGSNDLDNLCVACVPCNRSKGAKLLAEWRQA